MKRVLEPVERVSEIIFGVLMAMTFIGALSVADSGREDVRTAMVAALGCNLAWGLADAVMYIVGTLTERTREGTRLVFDDYWGAAGVFLLVALSTFPLVVPFLIFGELRPALIASRLVALVMLFVGGWMLARHAGGKPWRWGFGLAAVGAVLLAAIMALGG
jgi:VIT1/CCC1 family predicted Fe2+/Mn2+ transporter